MSTRRRPTIDRAVNDALIALYGPDTGPPRPDVPHDKYGLSWPTRSGRDVPIRVAVVPRCARSRVSRGDLSASRSVLQEAVSAD